MGWVLSVRAASLATIVVSVTTWTTSGIVPAMAQRTSGQEAGEARRPAELSRLLGVWRGTYVCAQGLTGLMLTVSGSRANVLEAEFAFYPVPENPRVPAGASGCRGCSTMPPRPSIYGRGNGSNGRQGT